MTNEELISQLYPDFVGFEHYGRIYNYQPIIDYLCPWILVQHSFSSYQGDTLILFKEGDKYGYLALCWGHVACVICCKHVRPSMPSPT